MNNQTAGDALAARAWPGEDLSDGRELLMSVMEPSTPTGAQIRVSFTPSASLTQASLAQATAEDLLEFDREWAQIAKKMGSASGFRVLSMDPGRIETVAGQRALVLQYDRSSALQPADWTVTQYQIPYRGGTLNLTLSHRKPDALIWKPILELVRGSLTLQPNSISNSKG